MKKIIMVVFVLTVLSVMGMGKNASAATVVPTATPSAMPYILGSEAAPIVKSWEKNDTWKTSGIYTYRVTDEGKKEIEIRKINSTDRAIVVPTQIDGYTVISVGYCGSVYKDYLYDEGNLALGICANTLEEITIPKTVREIGAEAFSGFVNLKEIQLPSKLMFLRNFAFHDCKQLDNIVIPDDVYIEDGAFLGCSSLKHVISGSVSVDSDSDGERVFDSKILTWHVKATGRKTAYFMDLGFSGTNAIQSLYCDSGLEAISIGQGNHEFIKKLFIQGQDTAFKINTDQKSIATALYTVHGAKCIKTAKKYRMTYHVKKVEKAKKLKRAKRQGKYQYRWGKSKTTITTHRYQKSSKKWKAKTKEEKTVYLIYERKTKLGAYQLVKTTTKRSYTSKVKRVKVKCQKTWK